MIKKRRRNINQSKPINQLTRKKIRKNKNDKLLNNGFKKILTKLKIIRQILRIKMIINQKFFGGIKKKNPMLISSKRKPKTKFFFIIRLHLLLLSIIIFFYD